MSTAVQTNKSQKYFDPDTLARIRPLGLRARTLVEGLIAGLHRSPLRGQSIEFAQHREYVPGDDVRQVDWKVYARSDKYYLRQYEDETNFTCQLLLDQSESMQYRSSKQGLSKLEYAQLIACSLAYLLIAQQDRAGLVTFSGDIDDWLPPSSSPNQFDDMIRMMEATAGAPKTDIAGVVERAVRQITTPSLIVILSDLFDSVDRLMAMLKLARYARHDVVLIHVLDPAELTFPFELMTRFEGLEGYSPLVSDPLLIGGAYRKAMAAFCQSVEQGCKQLNFDYYRMKTDESLAATLPTMLSSRLIRRG